MGEILECVRSIYQPADIQSQPVSFDMAPIRSSLPLHADSCEHTGSIPALQTPLPAPMDQSASPVPCIATADAISFEEKFSSSKVPVTEIDMTSSHENDHGTSNQDGSMPEISGSSIIVTHTDSKPLDAASVPLPPSPDPKT